jgi:hypothetical protein
MAIAVGGFALTEFDIELSLFILCTQSIEGFTKCRAAKLGYAYAQ